VVREMAQLLVFLTKVRCAARTWTLAYDVQ
jgi:hypothetical protein